MLSRFGGTGGRVALSVTLSCLLNSYRYNRDTLCHQHHFIVVGRRHCRYLGSVSGKNFASLLFDAGKLADQRTLYISPIVRAIHQVCVFRAMFQPCLGSRTKSAQTHLVFPFLRFWGQKVCVLTGMPHRASCTMRRCITTFESYEYGLCA